jgi:hypothetical protein
VKKRAWLPKYCISEGKGNHVALEGRKGVLINTNYNAEIKKKVRGF